MPRESAAPSKDEREVRETRPLVLAWRGGLAARRTHGSFFPNALKQIQTSSLSCTDSHFSAAMFQTSTVLSQLAEARRRPSPLNARALISPRWPLKERSSVPVATSQR